MTAISFPLSENVFLTAQAPRCRHLRELGALAVLGFLLLGCNEAREKLYPVSGKVTFQGKPVLAGMIRFSYPQAGIDMTANLRDGAYEVVMAHGAGLPEGTYLVAILPPRWEIPMPPPGKPVGPPPTPPVYPDIPAKYHLPSSSGLTLTVVPRANVFDVDMQP